MGSKKFEENDLLVVVNANGGILTKGRLIIVKELLPSGGIICGLVGKDVRVIITEDQLDKLMLAEEYCQVFTMIHTSGDISKVIKGDLPNGDHVYVEVDKESGDYLDSYLEGESAKDYMTSSRKVDDVDIEMAGSPNPIEEIYSAVFKKSSKIANLNITVNLEGDLQECLESIKEELEDLKRTLNIPVVGDYIIGELFGSRDDKVIGKIVGEDLEDTDGAGYMVKVISTVPYKASSEHLIGLRLFVKDSTVRKVDPKLTAIKRLEDAKEELEIANENVIEAREKMSTVTKNLFVKIN